MVYQVSIVRHFANVFYNLFLFVNSAALVIKALSENQGFILFLKGILFIFSVRTEILNIKFH